ncbi:hypothetical protein AAG570_010894, partial [Ranatra chinensis]
REISFDILSRQVASSHNYGAFVKIPGGNLQGLVHRTQVSSTSVDDVTQVLQKGDRVWCKVFKITDDGKLSLSMKVVDQGNGTDLDPNGVIMHQDEQRRKTRPDYSKRNTIKLEAVLNTTCTKCGTRGHIANDCFKSPDGKTYELVSDGEDETVTSLQAPPEELKSEEAKKILHKRKKKEKKSKKKHKRKRSSSSSSNSSTSSSSSEVKIGFFTCYLLLKSIVGTKC